MSWPYFSEPSAPAITVTETSETDTAQAITLFTPSVALPASPASLSSTTAPQKSAWLFELADSADLSKIAELKNASGRQLTLALNRPGSFQFSTPIDSELAYLLSEVSTCVLVKRWVNQNWKIVWSGPVWTIGEQTPNTVSVGCVGWLQTLEKRITRLEWGNPLVYTLQQSGAIALDLLQRSNAYAGSLGAPIYIGVGTADATEPFNRNIAPYTGILSEINALSEIENGYDMYVDPLTRELNIRSKMLNDRPEVHFENAFNVRSVSRNTDSGRICNSIVVTGSTGVASSQAFRDDLSIAAIGLFEESVSLSDVPNPGILAAQANAELGARAWPLRLYSFEPRKSAENDPKLFVDFELGDVVRLTAKKGRLQVTQQNVRVFGATLSWDQFGREQLSNVQTTASG